MICENLTIGTRIDQVKVGELTEICSNHKTLLSQKLAEKLNSNPTSMNLNSLEFAIPKKRELPEFVPSTKNLGAYCTQKEKNQIAERLLKSKEDIASSSSIDESKKSKKVIDSLTEFEDLLLAHHVVDQEKLVLIRKLHREILINSLQSPDEFKFTHLESIVLSIAVNSATLAGISVKKVVSMLELLFHKKLKMSKIRRSKGFGLIQKVDIRLWDVY